MQDIIELLQEIHDWIEDHDEWWMDCPDKGGFDLDKIKSGIKKAKTAQGN